MTDHNTAKNQRITGRDGKRAAPNAKSWSSRGGGATAHKFDEFLHVENFGVYIKNNKGNLFIHDEMGKGKGKDREVQKKKEGAVKRLKNFSAAMKKLGRRKRKGNVIS